MTTTDGRGARSPAPTRAGGTPFGRVLLLLLMGAWGCGGPAADESGAPEAPESTAETQAGAEASPTADEEEGRVRLARLGDFRSGAPRGERFAHDPHALIDCVTCHMDPPGHGSHASVRCSACHTDAGTGDRRPSPSECMACHHDPERPDPCTRCHDDAPDLPGATAVRSLRVAGAVRERALPFAHDLHASVACGTCHGAEGGDITRVDCAQCHDRHHAPEATCASCHREPPDQAHAGYDHRGCGGAGCHADATLPERPETRSACLSCHRDQTEHEPGRPCAPCHQLADLPGEPS